MAEEEETRGDSSILEFGVEEGQDVVLDTVYWDLATVPVGSILEVSLAGCSVGTGTDGWFAVLVTEVLETDPSGLLVGGKVLGCENTAHLPELVGHLSTGYVHLCKEDPCGNRSSAPPLVHATRVRLWRLANFECTYLSRSGKSILKNALNTTGKGVGTAPKRKAALSTPPKKKPKAKADSNKPRRSAGRPVGAGDCIDLEDETVSVEEDPKGPDAVQRSYLRSMLQQTRQRIAGSGGDRVRRSGEDLAGGAAPGPSRPAVAESRLVAGTSLRPGELTPLRLGQSGGTSEDEARRLRKQLTDRSDASSVLLAQAVQTTQRQHREKREKKESSKDRKIRKLAELLGGKKKKKKKRKQKESRGPHGPAMEGHIKPDPDPSDGSGGTSSSSSSSRGRRRRKRDDSSEDSDLSFEAPLRKKAAREPGSVMEMLIRHAQQQLDQGALLEDGGAAAGLTSGIKLSTFFALLIRPFHSNSSPLVRELFALGQSIDLLRAGRLPECADSLASRFIAVHTALSDGNWQVASQLEMYPLEPVQAATVATMLQAQKHRRLIQRSQGYSPSRWNSQGPGKGKGTGGWSEKGRKGDGNKGPGRGKGKGQPKGNQNKKGEANPWKESQEDPTKKT